MKHQKARAKVDSVALDTRAIYKISLTLFRRRNDYSLESLNELPDELRRFGITTAKTFRLLMKKHRRSLLMDENVRMKRAEVVWLSREAGFGGIDTHAGKSWMAIPGLVRQAMELEFGEVAIVYVAD